MTYTFKLLQVRDGIFEHELVLDNADWWGTFLLSINPENSSNPSGMFAVNRVRGTFDKTIIVKIIPHHDELDLYEREGRLIIKSNFEMEVTCDIIGNKYVNQKVDMQSDSY